MNHVMVTTPNRNPPTWAHQATADGPPARRGNPSHGLDQREVRMTKHSRRERERRAAETLRVREIETAWLGGSAAVFGWVARLGSRRLAA